MIEEMKRKMTYMIPEVSLNVITTGFMLSQSCQELDPRPEVDPWEEGSISEGEL